jgi:Rrf2 family protein
VRISTKARYGTRLMLELGLHYEQGPLLLKSIARLEDISQKYLSLIVIPLKNAGLVNSLRGARGGYVLARPPAQISMREVVEVLEGEINLVDCVKSPTSCARTSQCVTRALWANMGQKIIQVLEEFTLADLVDECKNKNCKNIVYSI